MPLEQQWHGRVPDLLVVVVGRHQGDGAVGCTDSGDDRGQDVGQLRGDDQEALGIGLAGGDLQQRDELTGGGKPVLDQTVMGKFSQFLDADPGQPKDLNGSPCPEGPSLFGLRVAAAGPQWGPRPTGGCRILSDALADAELHPRR